MSKLSEITRGKQSKPPRIVLYGVEGIGKSTFASKAPNPVFIPTEDGLSEIDCASFPICRSFEDMVENITLLGKEENEFKTVVIDSADWAEPVFVKAVCDDYGVDTIRKADGGFNHGWDRVADKWKKILNGLDWLRDTRGMTSIIIAHSKIKTIQDPENPPYDKYTLRLNEKSADVLKEWADAEMFATRKMLVSKDDGAKAKAVAIGRNGGDRILRTIAGPACDAKNRYNLPEELPLDWNAFTESIKANNKEN